MLELDSPLWAQLSHAYGSASDIPALLRQLEREPSQVSADYREAPWYTLWSSLCHQSTVYTASYAALPHIVRIGMTVIGLPPHDYFSLPASIEINRIRWSRNSTFANDSPPIPGFLIDPYFSGLRQLHDLAYRFAELQWPEVIGRAVASALLASKGQIDLAETIQHLDPQLLRAFQEDQGWPVEPPLPWA